MMMTTMMTIRASQALGVEISIPTTTRERTTKTMMTTKTTRFGRRRDPRRELCGGACLYLARLRP
jgi:hypothetical protein